jgi:hypothetical protein
VTTSSSFFFIESEDAQAPENANKELRIRLKELRRSQDADETQLQSKVFIEFSLCGKLCETNPSMEYPKSFDSPTKIYHDEIIVINVSFFWSEESSYIFQGRQRGRKSTEADDEWRVRF